MDALKTKWKGDTHSHETQIKEVCDETNAITYEIHTASYHPESWVVDTKTVFKYVSCFPKSCLSDKVKMNKDMALF